MQMLWIIPLLLVALSGLYFIVDFVRFSLIQGTRGRGEITGFAEGAFLGRAIKLPVLKFTDENGAEHEHAAMQIDQMMYLLNPANKRDLIDIVYNADNPSEMRVYGYLRLMLAFFIVAPSLGVVMWSVGTVLLASKFAYLVMFALMALGGLALIKMIQRYY